MNATDVVALTGLIVSFIALGVSVVAGIVAWLDYQQVGREEPWALSKVAPGFWLLERIHRKPVFITGYYMSHVGQVNFYTPAGIPTDVYRRGTKTLLAIPESNPGEFLTLEAFPAGKSGRYQGPLNSFRGGDAAPRSTVWATPTY